MKKLLILLCTISMLLCFVGSAGATPLQLAADAYKTPAGGQVIASINPPDDLNHYYYYTWAMNDVASTSPLTSVTIVFHNIYNWKNETNILKVFLFDNISAFPKADSIAAPLGWKSYGDNQSLITPNWSADFGGNLIDQWSYPNAYPTRYDVVFSTTDQNLLNYMSNGNSFAIGIDPDCHYYLDKITVETTNAPVPEPATMLLLGTGLIGLAGFGRKKLLRRA